MNPETAMIKVTDRIYIVPGENNGRFPYCHCVYVKDETCVLFDSAAGRRPLSPLRDKVDVLVNTHFHPDHIRGNDLFPRARIYAPLQDVPPIESQSEFLRYTGFDSFSAEEYSQVQELLQYKESKVDKTFVDGEVLDFGKTRFRVIHTPGHSPGHCCFFEENSGVLIGGDIDLTRFGPWYGHRLSDLDDFILSLEKVAGTDMGLFISSHEEALIKGDIKKRLSDYAAVFTEREKRILSALDTPATLEELVDMKLIYGRHPHSVFLLRYFEKQMLQKHLDRLLKAGKVVLEDSRYHVPGRRVRP